MLVHLNHALILDGRVIQPGARLELPDEQAANLIGHGHVYQVVPEPLVVIQPPRSAADVKSATVEEPDVYSVTPSPAPPQGPTVLVPPTSPAAPVVITKKGSK